MKVTRLQILARGLTNRCPNCGGHTLFQPRTLRVNKLCPQCGFRFERDRDEGFYLGALSLNYGVTLICFLLPVLLLAYHGVIGSTAAFVIAGVGAVGVPILLYRSSRSWWLMNYYLVFPHHLPANGGKGRPGDDDNV